MSEFIPIPITKKMVDPGAELELNVHPESWEANYRREMEAKAKKASALANNAEFQQYIVPIAAYSNLMSRNEPPSEEQIKAWGKARDDLFEWVRDFPGAAGMSESERDMAYVAVLGAMGE